MNRKIFFSIAIPFYFRDEYSLKQLKRCVNSIEKQSFKNLEVIISSQNKFKELKENRFFQKEFIKVFDAKDVNGFIQGNINNAFRFCRGSWIKILFSDDYFLNDDDLKNIYSFIKRQKSHWYIMNSLHCIKDNSSVFKPIIPFFHKWILDLNTVGSPSAILLKNENLVLFDKNTWMRLDVDYYYSLFLKFGKPSYISNVFIVNEIHKDQFSSIMINKTKEVKQRLIEELNYISKKYNYKRLKNINKLLFRLVIKLERFILNIFYRYCKKRFLNFVNIFFKFFYYLF